MRYKHSYNVDGVRQRYERAIQPRVLESRSVARIYFERRDLPEDLQRLFDMIWEAPASDSPVSAGECSPPLDIIETESSIEIVVDIPGVPAEAVHIVSARNVLMIAGQKVPPAYEHREAAFHLAERSFGRFARAVRLDGAFDAGRAIASFNAGELRITMPRIDERRGKEIRIPVRA
jgi:HSP20 family protein